MDDMSRAAANAEGDRQQRKIIETVKRRFGSHDVLYSKYIPQIPAQAEREYVRVTNAYMAILKEELERGLPKLKEAYKKNRDAEAKANARNDGFTDLLLSITEVFNEIKNRILSRTTGFGLRRKLERMAHLTRKLTIKEWKKAVKATLGIDIREDYYMGDFFSDMLEEWIDYNVSLIKTIPQDSLEKMREIVYDGYTKGKTTTRIVKEIQNAYGNSRRRAELIARDQISKLNGQISRAQQQDAGFEEYLWSTSKDERVRKSHRELEGKRFSWNDPPLNSDGRRCHPHEDYQCRCIARPLFNKNTLRLPIVDVPMKVTIR